jgi:hypothetical protein
MHAFLHELIAEATIEPLSGSTLPAFGVNSTGGA